MSERLIAKRTMICIAMRKKYDANMYYLPLPNNLKLDLIQCIVKDTFESKIIPIINIKYW